MMIFVLYLSCWFCHGEWKFARYFFVRKESDWFLVAMANPEAKRLYEELIKVRSYNKLIRPVKNNSEKLTVYLGLRLTQLLDVVCRE